MIGDLLMVYLICLIIVIAFLKLYCDVYYHYKRPLITIVIVFNKGFHNTPRFEDLVGSALCIIYFFITQFSVCYMITNKTQVT